MNFLGAVNRVLRHEGIISGDDDELATFTDTQHAATSQLAQIAIQDELTELIAAELLPQYAPTQTTVPTVTSTRTYNLASDFVRFRNDWFLEVDGSDISQNYQVFYYRGGEEQLQQDFMDYQSNSGKPRHWYWSGSITNKLVGFFPVPDSAITLRYYFHKDLSVTLISDAVPFVSEMEAQAFVQMASRRFTYLRIQDPKDRQVLFQNGIGRDAQRLEAHARLMLLLRGRDAPGVYGRAIES